MQILKTLARRIAPVAAIVALVAVEAAPRLHS
jgi:hypothetical protein